MASAPPGELILNPHGPANGLRAWVSDPFRFFFSVNGDKTAPAELADSNADGVPDYIDDQVRHVLLAYRVFVEDMGLPDLRTEGELAKQGMRFIDVTLDELPVQRGLASATVQQATPAFLLNTLWDGPSVSLRLHRALPVHSQTPAHELFHLFQYACLPFRNMWFMEGLARHAQRWVGDASPKQEPLPSTRRELEEVLARWHEAEPLWNRLSVLSWTGGTTPAASCGDNDRRTNPYLRGHRFVSVLFQKLQSQLALMQHDMPMRHIGQNGEWAAVERKSATNNRWLLRGIEQALVELSPKPSAELRQFQNLLLQIESELESALDAEARQHLFAVLEQHQLAAVHRNDLGRLRCDAFDPVTDTLSVAKLTVGAAMRPSDLQAFAALRGLIGSLEISDCPALETLQGFHNLTAVEGNVTLENTGFQALTEAFPQLQRIKGSLRIVNNTKLQVVDDFHALASIDNALEIENAPQLIQLQGFGVLVEIKKGKLSFAQCPRLQRIEGFQQLGHAAHVVMDRLAMEQVDFLRPLFERRSNFPGAIRLVSCRLRDIQALSSLHSVGSSLHLHGNRLTQVDALSQLQRVGGSLSLNRNRLEHVRGLAQLRRIGGMLGLSHNALRDLTGLENLTSVRTTLWNKVPRTVSINGNPELVDVTALAGVGTDDDYLILHADNVTQYKLRPPVDSRFHQNILQIHEGPEKRPFPTYLWTGKTTHDYRHFRRTTHNTKLTYLHDFETDADVLVLSFSGVNGKLGGVFNNRYPLITDGIATHKVFINDTSHRWYHGGVPDLTGDMQETIAYLRHLRNHRSYKKVVCIGVSMGAYMALLVGHQIGATDILAFAPQTFIDPTNRQQHGDRRWASMLRHLPPSAPAHFLDLAELYRTPANGSPRIQLHVGARLQADVIHAEHLAAVTPLALHAHDAEVHHISLHLDRVRGELNPLIRSVVMDGSNTTPSTPLFSVVVPAFNVADYIEGAVRSVQSQTCPDFELLVVDDGSTDNTLQIARQLANVEPRLRVLSQTNQGVGAARNTGLKAARGRYVVFLDADDWLTPDALNVFAQCMHDHPDAVFCNRSKCLEKTGQLTHEATFTAPSSGAVGPGRGLLRRFAVTGKTFRRDFLLRHELQFPAGMIWEDYPFSYGVLAAAERITVTPEHLYVYRVRHAVNPSLTQQKRLSPFAVQSRFRSIEACRSIVANSRLKTLFPAHNFDAVEFGHRLLTDIRHLSRGDIDQTTREAHRQYAEFLSRYKNAWQQAVSPEVARIFYAVLAGQVEETRTLLALASK